MKEFLWRFMSGLQNHYFIAEYLLNFAKRFKGGPVDHDAVKKTGSSTYQSLSARNTLFYMEQLFSF